MTAYGRSHVVTSLGRFVVEIKSLNRKFLDIDISLPKELSRFESDVRGWVASKVFRGKISVSVFATYEGKIPLTVTPNLPLARQIKGAWDALSAELEVKPVSDFSFLLLYEEEIENEEQYRNSLHQAFDQAMESFLSMKSIEGNALQQDVAKRLAFLKQSIDSIESKGTNATSKYREKLLQRIQEVLESVDETDERIIKEVALFADRIDISEEIARFRSHLQQFSQLMNSESVGKTLEFLVQELLREVNTIGSKSQDSEITHSVVSMKTEIERIREQIQNIE